MTPQEIVRAKNIDLLLNQYNAEVLKLNREGFIDKDSKKAKELRNRYENLMARFDTDKMTLNKKDSYKYTHPLDAKQLSGLNGVTKSIRIKGLDK